MNDLELERIAHLAADRTRAEASRIADSRSVLHVIMNDAARADATDAPTGTADVELELDREHGWRRPSRLVPILAAAAALIAVAGIVVASRGDGRSGIVVTTDPQPAVPDPIDEFVPDPTTPGTAPNTNDDLLAPAPTAPPVAETTATTQPTGTPTSPTGTIALPDGRGAQLAGTVLATYERGNGDGQLGFEECQECEPLRPWAPVVSENGTVFVADVYNGRWQVVRDGTWTAVPFPPGEVVVASPVVGPDGLIYAAVADALPPTNQRRVVAYDPLTLAVIATYEVAATETMYTAVVIENGAVRLGPSVVRTFDADLGTPTWIVDREEQSVDVGLSGVRHRFELPETWQVDPGAAAPLDDGSVVLHVVASDGEGRGDRLLVRLWADGSSAVGSIGADSSTTNLDGTFSSSGFVQLEDAIVEYAYPVFAGSDPLAGWSIPDTTGVDLDRIPRLVPDRLVTGATTSSRSDGPGITEPPHAYEQNWVRTAGDGTVDALLQISTYPEPRPITAVDVEIDITGWPQAYFVRTAGDGATLHLRSATRAATVWSRGLGRETVADIAQVLRVDDEGVGWDVDITKQGEWTPINEGWLGGIANRRVTQRDTGTAILLELLVTGGAPGAILTPGRLADDITLDQIDGRPALMFDDGFLAAVTWSPADDIVVVIGSRGPLDELVETARSIIEVDQPTWDALPPDPAPFDGCDSMFC